MKLGWGAPVSGGPTGTGTAATVVVDPETSIGTIGTDFVGLSFEKTHMMNGSLTSGNAGLIALFWGDLISRKYLPILS